MNPFLNSIEIIGNLGKKPILRYLPNQTSTTRLSIAVTERINKGDDQVSERTDWFTALLYGHLAELVCHHQDVGDSIYVRGSMRSRRYEQNEQEKMVWEITADKVVMISTKSSK